MLADATDEGWGCNVPQMHWAETGNMGYAPNEHLPKVFLATGHDAGDPWDDPCRGAPFCCLDTGKPVDKSCGPHRNFLAQTGQYPGTNEPVTPYFMGSIHPRTKKLVAQRLAKAAWAIVYEHDTPFTGPVLSGCGLSSDKSQLIIRFNDTFMFGDDLMVTNYSRNEQASAMFVRINVPLPDDAARNSLYENRKPWWGDEDTWVNVDIAAGPTPGKHEVVADLSKLPHNAVVTGVKYGHSIPGVFRAVTSVFAVELETCAWTPARQTAALSSRPTLNGQPCHSWPVLSRELASVSSHRSVMRLFELQVIRVVLPNERF